MSKLPKIVVVLGPTASGKTALGAVIGARFNGEIISADSRQVYRGLDLGTGKEQLEIPQHLIDVVDPGERFTVVEWKKRAETEIERLLQAGKLPVVVGGSSLYVSALIDNYQFAPEDEPGKLRTQLEQQDNEQLMNRLRELDLAKAATIDQHNKRYLVRAVERATLGDRNGPIKGKPKYEVLLIGIKLPREQLYQNIDRRVEERLKLGLLAEVQGLLDNGVDPDWLQRLGLEYKFLTRHLLGEVSLEAAIQQLKYATHHFARRQLIWWRHRENINWVSDQAKALALTDAFCHRSQAK